MAQAPRIDYLDGQGTTQELSVTTNLLTMSFTGSVDRSSVDVQIDVNGSGFVSDPSLVLLTSEGRISVPNPSSMPDGFPLERGRNTFRLRAVDITGSVSQVSTITVDVVPDVDITSAFPPPTGVSLRRRATTVDVLWSDVGTEGAAGYNIYASTGSGGTGSGYLRVNQDLIPISSPKEVVTSEVLMQSHEFDYSEDRTDVEFQIQLQHSDAVTGDITELKDLISWPLFTSPKFRFRGEILRLENVKHFVFNHSRNLGTASGFLNSDVFSGLLPEEPAYYVVAAVYYDRDTGQMVESRYSAELSGAPLPLDTVIRGIRIRDQRRVAEDYIGEVAKTQPTLSLIPGSSVREVHIEPFSNEVQKAYFLADFVHRAKSFPALLAIDDPSLSGSSVSVSLSQYKQQLKTALSVTDDTAVQSLIDGAFDSLSQNYGIKRAGRRAASVLQTFYTTSLPTQDLVVSQNAVVTSSTNSTAPRYRSQGQVSMLASQARSYYNPETRRYEIKVQLVAETPGSVGNVPAGDLDTISSGATGLQTVNDVSADFGRDVQSNTELAEDAMRATTSLDTGTAGGYERIAKSTPGLLESRVVMSGDPLMVRDWDPIRKRHTGGKVDVYVRGVVERTITETFAFQFSLAKNVRFDVVDPISLVLRARDSRLTPENPIQEMLFNPSQGLGLRNRSRPSVESYDLTGVTIIDYRTIRLSTIIPQPATTLDDFIEGDYRYRSNNKFVGTMQPIRRVVSVVGENSGPLDPDVGFLLFKPDDPLELGESTVATDYIEVRQVGSVPTGAAVPVTDERHVLIGEFEEPLQSVGANTFSIIVMSLDRTFVYDGPGTENPDYFIVGGGPTKPVRIVRSGDSSIPSGATVSIDYSHDENFVVTYVINDVLQSLQTKLNSSKHATADVVAKQAIDNPLVIEATVQLLPNAVQSQTESRIRTAITVLTDRKGIGGSVHQTDVSSAMKGADGVDFIVQPFARMSLRDGAVRVRDSIPSSGFMVPGLSRFANAVYFLEEEVPYATSDAGGPETVHRSVFIDNIAMVMARSVEDVGSAVNQAWIIGSNGAVIPGYSDDATLLAAVPPPSDLAAARALKTGNRILVSLDAGATPPDVPAAHFFTATYVVSGDRKIQDVETSQVEFASPGDLTLTFRSA